MLVKDVISRIRFNTNTNDDNTGRNINPLFSNTNLVAELQMVLNQYASFTKALQAIHTTPVQANTRSIQGPSDIIRKQGYKFVFIWLQGRKYPINAQPLVTTQTEFPTMGTVGIPQYITIWDNEVSFYPLPSSSRQETQLTNDITASQINIDVSSTSSFIPQNGVITIGDEKIRYTSKTATQFLNCTRAYEGTIAAEHAANAVVQENNLYIYYCKYPFTIFVDSSDIISENDLNRDLGINEEHMPSIINLTTYNLLNKIDPTRAQPYKIDAVAFLSQAKSDVEQGDSAISPGSYIGRAYDWQGSNIGVSL
jgi:hypothetical protein